MLAVRPKTNPELKSVVLNWHHPAPVLPKWLAGLETFLPHSGDKEIGKPLSKTVWVQGRLVLIAGRKKIGAEFNMRFHSILRAMRTRPVFHGLP